MVNPFTITQLQEIEAQLASVRDDLAECQRVAEKLNTAIEELVFTNKIQERATRYAALMAQTGEEAGTAFIRAGKFEHFDEQEAARLSRAAYFLAEEHETNGTDGHP